MEGQGTPAQYPLVDGKSNFVRYWAFSRDHCGKSFLLIGSRVNYLPWRYLHLSAINIISHFGHSRGRVHWKVDWNKEKSYYYSWLWFNKIVLNKYGYDHPWIVAHEYTHALHDKGLGGRWKVRNCSPHYLDSISSYTCAFSEGLADYGGVIGSGGDFRRYFEEFDNAEPGVKGKIEGHVAALFMDLIDDEDEEGDKTSLYSRYVIDVFKTCRVNVSSWKDRNDVSDFVWCLERSPNNALHRRHFPGIDPPRRVSEQAKEPPDWDRAKIRSTWLHNLKR